LSQISVNNPKIVYQGTWWNGYVRDEDYTHNSTHSAVKHNRKLNYINFWEEETIFQDIFLNLPKG